MGSGFWPIDKIDKEGKDLLEAIRLAEKVYDEVGYDDSQFDNAYSDGCYKESLCEAISLMKRCVR